jgi:hypothetical protein
MIAFVFMMQIYSCFFFFQTSFIENFSFISSISFFILAADS